MLLRLLPFLLLFAFFACEEIPPVVTPATPGQPTDTSSVEDQRRQVLIEEFTGVRCVNCPAGSAAIEDLLAIHGERLIAVSIHAGFFSDPPNSENQVEFRTDDGTDLLGFLGEPLGYPTAVIDRRAFIGGDLQTGSGDWAGIIAQELQTTPRVKIDLQSSYDGGTRELTITSKFLIEDNIIADDIRYTILLTESDIADAQITPGGLQLDYRHQHALRDILTNFSGDALGSQLAAGETVEKSITYTLPDDWDDSHIEVVAFAHLGGEKHVLQAAKRKVE